LIATGQLRAVGLLVISVRRICMKYSELSRFAEVSFTHVITKKVLVGKVVDLNKDTEEALVSVEGSKADWKKAHDLTKVG